MTEVIIFDTDIASTFGKIKKLFSKHRIVITPKIYEELAISLNYGYKFPSDIFKNFGVLYLSEKEEKEYLNSSLKKKKLGKGELEAIMICKSREYVFSSLDNIALNSAEEKGIKTIELHSILRALWKSGLKSKDDVREIIKEIEEKDNTRIKDVEKIFELESVHA